MIDIAKDIDINSLTTDCLRKSGDNIANINGKGKLQIRCVDNISKLSTLNLLIRNVKTIKLTYPISISFL